MMEIPAETPVTSPVPGFTVATAGLPLLQVPPGTVETKFVEEPTQTDCAPNNWPAVKTVVIVTWRVAVAFGQPLLPGTVYVMVTVPGETAVSNPVAGSILAMRILLLLQIPPGAVDE
jgi:hypothetical protein